MKNNKLKQGYVQLNNIKVSNNRVDYYFSVSQDLKKFFDNSLHMFIEYDEEVKDIPNSILVIPFVANVMPLMWITNSVLWVNEIDREYYDSLSRVKSAYQDMYFNYKFGGLIVAAKTINNVYEIKRPAAQLFSGGLDAITTCIRINDKNPLLINIYGWYKNNIEPNAVFDSDRNNILEFATRNSLEAKFIKSNFATMIIAREVDKVYRKKLKDSWWHGLQHGMCFIGHAIPLAYKYRVENIYIANSFPLGGERHTCSSDPVVDIQVKYGSGGVIHDGCELTRQDKVKIISDKQKEINNLYPLRVCSFNDKNCCECEKCFRTILGLVAEGADIRNFGFNINEDLKTYFSKLMEEKIHLWGVERESLIHWPDIKARMIENKDNIKEKEFVNWFLTYDFFYERKKAVFKYRVKNFIPILKRKIMRGNS